MRRNRSVLRLTRLYLSYHLNGVFYIILGTILFLWAIALLINTGFPLEMEDYILESKSYHVNYLEQSLFLLQIINGVLVAFLVGAEINSFALFDPMLVPSENRQKIILSKLLANIVILFLILCFEVLILYLVGVGVYANFVATGKNFLLVIYLLMPTIELLLIGEGLAILMNTYFISILIFFIHILLVSLSRVNGIKESLTLFIPQLTFSASTIQIDFQPILYFSFCGVLLLGIMLLFQRKDICTG